MSEWDDYAADWDSPDTRLYADRAFASWQRSVAPFAPDLAQCRVLDFGCGTGLLSETFAPLCKGIVAIDTSPQMIAVLEKKIETAGIANIRPLATAIDPASIRVHDCLAGGFDIVLASSVWSFLPDYPATLADLASLLEPGGIFTQWDWESDMPAKRIADAMDASGLEKIAIETAFGLEGGDETMPVIMGTARRS
ncbi:MAG: class I SAM-dependent methyltransferase [Sphingomonadaceae bacterium]|nr:class I SAM-dependent methyltransferase [Sphingomonadaceae bacterium]